jgi:hypothetical protein
MGTSAFRLSGGASADLPGVDVSRPDFAAAFADDVLVAFPSVATVVDRMRDPFVDDGPGTPLPAEVVLSPRQALTGATVPLEVPLRCTCRVCGGRGECWAEPCPRCVGSGVELRRHAVLVSVPARVADGRTFRMVLTSRSHPSTRVAVRVAVR